MAISPPSDIVLDVARAVDPAAIEQAKTALSRRAGGASASFGLSLPRDGLRAGLNGAVPPGAVVREAPDPFTKFEAMVMQSFVQAMLPKDSGSVYGQGMAGDMWKSQMAEQISTVIAERGGIGIADRILRGRYAVGDQMVPISGATGEAAQVEGERRNSVATALVHELQRKLNGGLVADTTTSEGRKP